MKIEKIKDDHYKVTLESGEVVVLDWGELCGISHFVDVETAKEEVEEFLEYRDDYNGVNLEEKRSNPEFIESLAYDLISVRTNNETEDDVYDALVSTLSREGSCEN